MNQISVNQSVAPVSNLTVPGLFPVPGVATKLADLVNGAGVRLGDLVPQAALRVFVHSGNNTGADFFIEAPGIPIPASPTKGGPLILLTPGGTVTLGAQENCELSVADLGTHSIHAETPGDCISVRYTRYAQDRE